jgi:hypothetical protein
METASPFDNWSSTVMQLAIAGFFGWKAYKRERSIARR